MSHFKNINTEEITVPCLPPETILMEVFKQNTTYIDFFSLDVEGAEKQVLMDLLPLLQNGNLVVKTWSIEYREWDGKKVVAAKTLENLKFLRNYFSPLGYKEWGRLTNKGMATDIGGLDVLFVRSIEK